jgi:hypothetical protein
MAKQQDPTGPRQSPNPPSRPAPSPPSRPTPSPPRPREGGDGLERKGTPRPPRR